MATQAPPPVLMPPPVPGKGPGAPGSPPAPPGAPGAPTAGAKLQGAGKPGDPNQPGEGAEVVTLNFWQQPWVQNVLPFVTSLALHAAVVIMGLTVWKVVEEVRKMQPNQEQLVVPSADLAGDVPGGVEHPGIGGDPNRDAAQDKYENVPEEGGWAPEPGESEIAEAVGGGAGDTSDGLFALGPNARMGKGSGSGTGIGEGHGSGTGTGRGKLAPFGAPGGGTPGPRGKMFGNGGSAMTIAFVCDASGSMISKLSALKQEMVKEIQAMKPVQAFSIVFFQDQKCLAFENGALVSATSENKRKAEKWLDDVQTTGDTNPIPGLEVAFKGKPALVYLLTDGDFPDNSAVLNKLTQLNTGAKKSRINTIAFVDDKDDDTSQGFIDLLKKIAEENGGKFNHVTEDDLE